MNSIQNKHIQKDVIMDKKILEKVWEIAVLNGFTDKVTEENVKEILVSLVENHTDSFVKSITYMYDFAVRNYTSRGDKGDEIYHNVTDLADSILALLDIQTDYPGLYPTYELSRNGKHFTEYSVLNAIRQYNNYWNHW